MFRRFLSRTLIATVAAGLLATLSGVDEAEASPRVIVRAPASRIVAPQPRVYVSTRPSVRPRSPGVNYVWVDGYWTVRHGRRVWVTGYWDSVRPVCTTRWTHQYGRATRVTTCR